MQKPYLFWGTMAMAAMMLVLPSAVDWFRRRNYETFLLLHIAFSVATVIGCFYHTVIFEGHEYWLYLWPVVGIWALDRFLRLIRLAYCNIYVRAHAGKGLQYRSLNTTILIEGPYGEEFPAWNYESILFVAGGTGIAAIVPYIQDHLARSATADGSATRVQDMHLVWTTRQAAFVRQLATGELSPALARSDFDAAFYVTSPGEGYNDEDLRSSVHDEVLDKDLEINMGRPDLQSRILSHAHDAQLRGCSALVLVCGPSAMADQARDAVYRAMRQGYQGIRYVEESFTW
ncbi:hypothetical protein N8T08_001737 [Aspergillus melleus]|uniref:Uncharacterized protein n=1 Tax=Aspergillus melleus TaxID=138277 RepID=A0ACC3AMT2_9EURO|nr:hypothetical protein N8T08_001737 [Aspergillus melleus]